MSVDPKRTAGCLYLVGTPIGNLEDITYRAVRILGEADQILAEDTRRARILLDRYAIARPLSSFFEHNEVRRLEPVMRSLGEGRRVALITDAGSPGISDPGYRLVREAVARGIPVVSVPGPSAAVTALQVSGLPTDQFLFRGFPPRKSGARRRELEELREYEGTLVFYESPHRLAEFLLDASAALGDRPAAVCRELTKMHEEVVRGPLPELAARFGESPPRGEIAVVIGGLTRAPARRAGAVRRAGRALNLGVKERARALAAGPAKALAGAGVTATHLTVTGFLLSVAAAVMLARGRYDWTAGLLIVSGLCDTMDGAVARAGAGETRLGAFLDSTLDRAGESAVYVGSAWRGLALVREWAGPRWDVTLPVLALASSLLVSYVRARAEGLGAECRVGLMERTERMVLLIAAALAAVFWEPSWAWALAALSALNFVTFAQRLVHVGRALR